MNTVNIPTIIKVMVAIIDLNEKRLIPLIPCPLVQPLLNLVPKPTNAPPPINKNKDKPLFNSNFSISTNKEIDKKLIIGSIFFGAGWGLAGLCPGPAISSIALLNVSSGIFVISMFVGFYIAYKTN